MENFYERARVAFTAAMIRGDVEAASRRLKNVSAALQGRPRLSEMSQKAIRQLLAAAKKIGAGQPEFVGRALRQPRAELKTALARVARAQVHSVEHVGYDDWRRKLALDDDQYRLLLQNVASCQLSVGCSNFCRWCNEWALPGVRKHFSFDAAQRIVRDLHLCGNESYALYGASDPLDYRCGNRTIADLLEFMRRQGYRPRFGLLTKVPRGSKAIARRCLAADADIAVSLTAKNRARVAAIELEVGKTFKAHHDTAELVIPAGLDEDFSTVKSSITDNYGIEITPEAAWMVIPTFTSALYPTGQCRFPITAIPEGFILKRVGREALPVEYFKPLSVTGSDGRRLVLDHLLAPQVANILLDGGDQGPTPPGMMSLAEYFKTFEPDIVRRRERMAPVVIESLRRQVFATAKTAGSDRQVLEALFLRKQQAFLDFCDPVKVAGLKRKALAFFLAAAVAYLNTHPDECEIIRHLRRGEGNESEGQRSPAGQPGVTVVEILLSESGTSAFDCFRSLLDRLLADPSDGTVATFLDTTPARYDPELDRFV